MLTLTSDIPTWAHRVPAGVKFACLCGATLALVSFPFWQVQAAGLAIAIGLYLSGGTAFARSGLRAFRIILIIAVCLGLWHVITGRVDLAVLTVLRLFAVVGLATFVTMTTRLDEVVAMLDRLLAVLRVPKTLRRRFGLAIALMLRFYPVLSDKAERLSEAWRARSTKRLSPRIVLPMAILAIDDAEQVSEALRARGGA